MTRTTINEIEGSTTVELPRGEFAETDFKIYSDGDIRIEFTAPGFATDIIHELIRNKLIYLTVGYAAAKPAGETLPINTDAHRIRLARQALVNTGYFTEDEVSDDIAPRITEMKSKMDEIDRNARAYGWEVAKGNLLMDGKSIVMSSDNPFADEDWRDRLSVSGMSLSAIVRHVRWHEGRGETMCKCDSIDGRHE